MVFFQAHLVKKRKQIGHNLVPTYKTFVAFSLNTWQNKLKTKDKKARTTLESQSARKRPGKKPHIPKMVQFLKGGKNGHFAKAIAKQNGHKWSILGLCLKMPKLDRKYPLKWLELFYAENTLHIRKMTGRWKEPELAIVRQSGQKTFILSRNFKGPKIYKKWLRSHYSYCVLGLNTHLIFNNYSMSARWIWDGK